MLKARDNAESCEKCGSDLVLTRGPGRTALFEWVTLTVPEAMELLRCHGCGTAYPTRAQAEELLDVVERDLCGYGSNGRPVLST